MRKKAATKPELLKIPGGPKGVGNNSITGMTLKAAIVFPNALATTIHLNEVLNNFFRKKSKRILRISKRRGIILSQMPPITINELEKHGPIYTFSEQYLDRWLLPLIDKL